MMDPETSLEQIRDLQEKIQTLQNMVKKLRKKYHGKNSKFYD